MGQLGIGLIYRSSKGGFPRPPFLFWITLGSHVKIEPRKGKFMRSIRGSSKGWSRLKSKKQKPKSKDQMRCYEKRAEALSLLGFADYKEYRESELWKGIRGKKLSRFRNCLICNVPAFEVHHLSYDTQTLLGQKEFRLVQLCRGCHQRIEFDGDKKRHLKDANRVLFEMAERTERGRKWIEWHGHQNEIYKRNVRLENRKKRREAKANRKGK